MTISRLLLAIGIAIIGFWVLGVVLHIAAFILGVALFIGLVLVVASLIDMYITGKKK